jgi:DNA helicase HerA-like ATPase
MRTLILSSILYMSDSSQILIGGGVDGAVALLTRMANRHGLIAGATGTGKTVTLQVLAENFSRAGVPVFMADVKGDLSGLARPGASNDKIEKRLATLGLKDWSAHPSPVVFWDLYGEAGHPIRTTISSSTRRTTATCPRPASPPSSARCWCWSSRARTNSSASRRSS